MSTETASPSKPHAADARTPNAGQTKILFAVVILAYTGQMILNPILAPLARTLGMQEWSVGAIISTAALMFTLFSRFWGPYAQKAGVKRVLAISMMGACIALGSFAAVAIAADRALIAGFWLVFGALATRGFLYGCSISGVMPAAQYYLVSNSHTEEERVKSVGALGAMNGFSGILGSIAGGILSMIGGLMLPLVVMPFMMLAAFAVVVLAFNPEATRAQENRPRKVRYFDRRVLPFLLVGFTLLLTFSSIQSVFGFMIQDQLELDAAQTAAYTAALMILTSVIMILFQGVIAPRLKLSARSMLRTGMGLVTVGCALFLAASTLPLIVAACTLMGAGCGFAMPGYNVGPTLNVEPEEQGGLAGLIMSNNGLTYIIAPLLSTSLYGLSSAAPFALSLALVAAGFVLCLVHPRLR